MFSIAANDFIFLTVFTISNPFHCCYTFPQPPCSQGRHLFGSVHLPPGSWSPTLEGWDQTAWGVLQELSVPVDFHFSCLLLLSLLLKWFLCSKSSNLLFLWILLINLINYAPRQLIFTSVKLKGCKRYLMSEEELESAWSLCLFQGYQLSDYEVLSLPTNLGTVFSMLYCSPKHCALVSSVLHGSHISRSVGRSSIARRFQIIWVKHSQACYGVMKKTLNGIKPLLQTATLSIKKITCQESTELGCKFPFYLYLQALTFLWKTMTFFDTMVT